MESNFKMTKREHTKAEVLERVEAMVEVVEAMARGRVARTRAKAAARAATARIEGSSSASVLHP